MPPEVFRSNIRGLRTPELQIYGESAFLPFLLGNSIQDAEGLGFPVYACFLEPRKKRCIFLTRRSNFLERFKARLPRPQKYRTFRSSGTGSGYMYFGTARSNPIRRYSSRKACLSFRVASLGKNPPFVRLIFRGRVHQMREDLADSKASLPDTVLHMHMEIPLSSLGKPPSEAS